MEKKYTEIKPEMVTELRTGLTQDLGLENYIKFDTNQEKLLYNLSLAGKYGNKQTTPLEDVTTGFVTREFENQLKQQGYISPNNAYNTLKQNLTRRVENQGFMLTPEKQDLILSGVPVIGLNHDVIKNRYGFYSTPEMTYKELAKHLERSPERMRQIEHRSLRTVQYTPRFRTYGFDIMYGTSKDIKEALHNEQKQKEQTQKRILEAQDTIIKNSQDALSLPVDKLELSIRSENILRNAEITTVGQLIQKTPEEMLEMKNMGRKSLNEMRTMLAEMGLSFGMKL